MSKNITLTWMELEGIMRSEISHFYNQKVSNCILMIQKKRISVGEDVEKFEPSYTPSRNIKWHSHFEKQSGSSSNCNTQLSYDPVILFLGKYQEK